MKTRLTQSVLQEIDYGLPGRDPDAVRAADDCLRLFDTPEEDFRWVKEQTWYRRLWTSFGRENLSLLGARCEHLEQAQGFALELLRLVAHAHPAGRRFLAGLSAELERLAARRGTLSPGLSRLRAEVARIEERLGWTLEQAGGERELPEGLRVLLLRAMIAAAWADGHIGDEEVTLISRKVRALELSTAASRQVLEEIRRPHPLDADLDEIEDYGVRLLVYRNVAAVTVADGHISLRENLMLGQLADRLRIREEDSTRIEQELFRLITTRGLAPLLDSVTEEEGAPRTEPPGPPDRDRPPPPFPPEERASPRSAPGPPGLEVARGRARGRILWTRLASRLAGETARTVMAPLQERLSRLPRRPDLSHLLSALESTPLARDVEEALESAAARVGGELEALAVRCPLPDLVPGDLWGPDQAERLRTVLERGAHRIRAGLEALAGAEERLRHALETEVTPDYPSLAGLVGGPSHPASLLRALLAEREETRLQESAARAYGDAVRELLAIAERAADALAEATFAVVRERLEERLSPSLAGALRSLPPEEVERALVATLAPETLDPPAPR